MLLSHKNFHFTQIPDKTNDVMFLKSPKVQVSEKTNVPIPRKLADRRKDWQSDPIL